MGGLAWAAFHTYAVLNGSRREPDLARDTQDIHEVLKLHSLLEVKDRYAAFSDQLESGVGELRESLLVFLRDKDRGEIGRYHRKCDAIEAWLRKQRENVDPRKDQMLRDWLASPAISAGRAPGSSATSALNVAINLEKLLAQADRAFSNYQATVPLIGGKPVTPDVVQKKLLKATEPEMELLNLARQARDQATAIGLFVEQRPAELAGQAGARRDREGLSAFITATRTGLQPVFYVLIIALILQSALILLALYGRFVVTPMRQKMLEDTTSIEHERKLDHFARLATSLAHEIRNPLTAINVRLFTLQKALTRGSTEHADAALIRNEIDRLEQILKNFLKLSRPTESKLARLQAEPTLREVCDLLAPQLKRQAIEVKVAEVEDVWFDADPVQLKQVLINLIQNAADAIGRRGTITLRAHRKETRTAGKATASIILEVTDTGGGIPPEVQDRLFDPFFSTKENGTGLGLPIAAKIIDQHRGLLDFESREGDGTTFRVILPSAP